LAFRSVGVVARSRHFCTNKPASEACPDFPDVNFAQLVVRGELEGRIHGTSVAEELLCHGLVRGLNLSNQ